MADRVYKITEVVGVSKKSFADACGNAVKRASKTIHGLSWFEVVELRGRIEGDKISEFQSTVKLGFKLDE